MILQHGTERQPTACNRELEHIGQRNLKALPEVFLI